PPRGRPSTPRLAEPLASRHHARYPRSLADRARRHGDAHTRTAERPLGLAPRPATLRRTMTSQRTRPSLPPEIAYYRRHLLAGRFRLAPFRVLPASGDIPPPHDERLMLPKAALL